MDEARIDARRLAVRLLVAFVLPPAIGIGADVSLGTWPYLTIVLGAAAIPLALWWVLRPVVAEFQRVVQVLAPAEDEGGDGPDRSRWQLGREAREYSEPVDSQSHVEGEDQ